MKQSKRKNAMRFQAHLQRTVRSRLLIMVLCSVILFIVGQQAITITTNEHNANIHLEQLVESIMDFDEESRDFLNGLEEGGLTHEIMLHSDPDALEQMKAKFWGFQERSGIESQILFVNVGGDVLYTSFGENYLSSYLLNYNNAICYKVKNAGQTEVYRAVYYENGSYADTMYVKPHYDDGELKGFVTIFLSGSAWSYYLSESDFDGVITDERDNAMYISKPGLLGGSNKFHGKSAGTWKTDNGSRYWIVSRELPDLQARVYSLVYYPPNRGLYLGLFLLLAMGVVWFAMADWISRSMAERNSESIGALVHEVGIVRKDHSHRIELHTGDEFEEVGQQINTMVENIIEMGNRNIELTKLNARIEMKQLTTQMNPHFLYNTLEIIRSYLSFEPETSEDMIVDLSEILRYSVDSSRLEVRLSEDLNYIENYLRIQRCRFSERFHCDIELDEECGQCFVPKLLLQPLIENSIKYGFRKKMNLTITITGKVEGGMLKIRVSDDGLGMDPQEAETLQTQLLSYFEGAQSIGLRNLSRRLHLKYGNRSGLQIQNRPGIGFDVLVTIEQLEVSDDV